MRFDLGEKTEIRAPIDAIAQTMKSLLVNDILAVAGVLSFGSQN